MSGYSTTGSTFESYTLVGDVTILRLKFETDGITYNLGVIDNKQTGGKEPSNETEIDVSLNNRGKTILYLLLLILLLVLLAPVLPYVLQAIVFVISLRLKELQQSERFANESGRNEKNEKFTKKS